MQLSTPQVRNHMLRSAWVQQPSSGECRTGCSTQSICSCEESGTNVGLLVSGHLQSSSLTQAVMALLALLMQDVVPLLRYASHAVRVTSSHTSCQVILPDNSMFGTVPYWLQGQRCGTCTVHGGAGSENDVSGGRNPRHRELRGSCNGRNGSP